MTLTTSELQALSDCIDEAESSYGQRETFDAPDPEEAEALNNRRLTLSHARNALHKLLTPPPEHQISPGMGTQAQPNYRTPGPWVYAYGSVWAGDPVPLTPAEYPAKLLVADRDEPLTYGAERDANTCLAAHAPEMLEALRLVLSRGAGSSDTTEVLRDVIERATDGVGS